MELLRDNDVVVTGVPRSGTTLTCHLLNRLSDTVALHEPVSLSELRGARRTSSTSDLADAVGAFFDATRRSLLERGTAVSKHAQGRVPDNPIGSGPGATPLRALGRRWSRRLRGLAPLRRGGVHKGVIRVGKPLSRDFLLCIKHPSLFTALLDELAQRHPCYAVVRNPLSILGSWNSIEYAVSGGHSRAAERLDPALASALRGCRDTVERQITLLDWYFQRYRERLPPEHVIRYEALVASKGAALRVFPGGGGEIAPELESRNLNKLYDRELMLSLGERLLDSPGAFWDFYSRGDVEALLAAYDEGGQSQ